MHSTVDSKTCYTSILKKLHRFNINYTESHGNTDGGHLSKNEEARKALLKKIHLSLNV
jgi:hypothetical protein